MSQPTETVDELVLLARQNVAAARGAALSFSPGQPLVRDVVAREKHRQD